MLWSWPRPINFAQQCTSFTKMNYVGEVWARVDQRKKINDGFYLKTFYGWSIYKQE